MVLLRKYVEALVYHLYYSLSYYLHNFFGFTNVAKLWDIL